MKGINGRWMTVLFVVMLFTGCVRGDKIVYHKYDSSFFDTFDTVTQVVGYTKTKEEFESYVEKIHQRFLALHKLYDIYNNYEGINNVKTINDNAGIKPVKVDKEIIDLLIFSKEWYDRTGGKTNIAMGAVLEIWHDYREQGMLDPENAKLPPMEELIEAGKHMDIEKVIIDIENSTVYLDDEKMKLNVGAVAKGYAAELVAEEIIEEGFTSGLISAGGNIRVLGKPLDGLRERWGVGIQNPDKYIVGEQENLLDTVFMSEGSVVSSGDYQRYYVVDGKALHHLIDPKTLMPGAYYKAVTIITEDSGIADYLSTAVFLMAYEESKVFVESLDGVEAIWVMLDGKMAATEGAKKIMKSQGATGGTAGK
ncbi:MAG: FAD:protein FMN transferase [Thermotaleaceae bacterium]